MSKTDLALEGGSLLASVNHPALAAVLAGGKLSLGVVRKLYPDADAGMAGFINEEVQQAVFTRLPEIERGMREIKEKLGDEPSATQIALVYKAFVNGFTQADGKKRKTLLNALVNAFDPQIYEQSMTARLLALINDLDYPDLTFLIKVDGGPDKQSSLREIKSFDRYHTTRLMNAGLMVQGGGGSDAAFVTELGSMMVRLIKDPKTAEL